MTVSVKAASVGDIPPGAAKQVTVNGVEIALFNIGGAEGKLCAVDNTCPHRGAPLADGFAEEGILTCSWHGWRFNLTSGAAEVSPDIVQPTYPVKVEGGSVYVGI